MKTHHLFLALIFGLSTLPSYSQDAAPAAPVEIPKAPDSNPEPAPTPDAPPPAPAPPTAPPEKLDVGSKVSLDAVKAATWLQGAPPESFEPGKVYIFEAWATWCGPCIRAIPHMNQLHVKYHDKGLRIYGMNVFENGQEKVANFVKMKAAEMTYPVAYTGRESRFHTEWMKAAGVRGIPHSFVVIDGVIAMRMHPAGLTEPLIEKLLAGGETARQAISEHANRPKSPQRRPATPSPQLEFFAASIKGDIPTMERIHAAMEKEKPNDPFLAHMKIDLMFAKKQWDALNESLIDPPATPEQANTASRIANKLAMNLSRQPNIPVDLYAKAAGISAKKLAESERTTPSEWVNLSRLQFAAGNHEAATASALEALEKARSQPPGRNFPVAAFEKFSEEVKAGRMPATSDFNRWAIEAMPKQPSKTVQ